MCDHEGKLCPGRPCHCVCMNCPDDNDWIEVTEAHIARGSAGSTTSCPVALALQDHFDSAARVGVTTATIGDREGSRVDFDLPCYVSTWIESFDAAKDVQPMRFRLIAP